MKMAASKFVPFTSKTTSDFFSVCTLRNKWLHQTAIPASHIIHWLCMSSCFQLMCSCLTMQCMSHCELWHMHVHIHISNTVPGSEWRHGWSLPFHFQPSQTYEDRIKGRMAVKMKVLPSEKSTKFKVGVCESKGNLTERERRVSEMVHGLTFALFVVPTSLHEIQT